MKNILRLGLGSGFALILAACGTPGTDQASGKASAGRIAARAMQAKRESTLQKTWQGRPYDALLEAYGEPKLTMNVLGFRPLKTSLVVYGVVDEGANCVDAFTMVKQADTGQWAVADYFCR